MIDYIVIDDPMNNENVNKTSEESEKFVEEWFDKKLWGNSDDHVVIISRVHPCDVYDVIVEKEEGGNNIIRCCCCSVDFGWWMV